MSAERQKQTDRSLKYLQDRCLSSAQLAYWVIAASLWEAESLQESFQINSVENIHYSSGDSVLLVSSGCVWFLNTKYAITHTSKACMTPGQEKNPGKSTSSIFHSVSQQLFYAAPPVVHQGFVFNSPVPRGNETTFSFKWAPYSSCFITVSYREHPAIHHMLRRCGTYILRKHTDCMWVVLCGSIRFNCKIMFD